MEKRGKIKAGRTDTGTFPAEARC